jgi:hypothetical protein
LLRLSGANYSLARRLGVGGLISNKLLAASRKTAYKRGLPQIRGTEKTRTVMRFAIITYVAIAALFSGCAYEGVIVDKQFRPAPFIASMGIDGIYKFQLRDSSGQIHSQMVTPDVFASYVVGDYFNDLQPPPERDPKDPKSAPAPPPVEMNQLPYQPVKTTRASDRVKGAVKSVQAQRHPSRVRQTARNRTAKTTGFANAKRRTTSATKTVNAQHRAKRPTKGSQTKRYANRTGKSAKTKKRTISATKSVNAQHQAKRPIKSSQTKRQAGGTRKSVKAKSRTAIKIASAQRFTKNRPKLGAAKNSTVRLSKTVKSQQHVKHSTKTAKAKHRSTRTKAVKARQKSKQHPKITAKHRTRKHRDSTSVAAAF